MESRPGRYTLAAMNDRPAGWTDRLIAAPPWVKLIAWAAVTLAIAVPIQVAAWASGLQEHIFGETAQYVLLPVALMTLSLMAVLERRPAAQYGLAIGDRWRPGFFGGLAAGVGATAAYYIVAWRLGALGWPGVMYFSDWFDVIWIIPISLLIAFSLQIILSGYFLGLFRERYGNLAAIAISAAALPLLLRLNRPDELLAGPGWQREIGLLCTQLLLGAVRIASGNILAPGAILAGFLIVQKTNDQAHLLDRAKESPLLAWFAPHLDPVQAPIFWMVLAAAALPAIVLALRQPRTDAVPESAIPASLKRVYPLAMPMCLAPIEVVVHVLALAKWRVGRDYLLRLAGMIVLGGINGLICLPERLLAPLIARRRVLDPVFILGVHRSGTTHLHNLLALDPNLVAPRNHHVLNPCGALFAGWPMSGMLAAFLPWQRPMDAVQFHVFSANEEEFAIACTSRLSPYWGWVFPEQGAAYDRFFLLEGFTPAERRRWGRINLAFLRKLVFWNNRRPVLKNPCNTGRLPMLLELFPDARIVHIHRNPYDVYRSNVHFAREGQVLFQLHDPPASNTYADRFLDNYAAIERAFYRDAAALAENRFSEVRFEDLERDPIGVIEAIYAQLELPLTPEFRSRLDAYVASVAGYQKNKHRAMAEEDRRRIDAAVGDLMTRWGYAAAELPA
ncbi:MAG: hypothetical protein AMXMBFR47_00490 [Planctomycetota bacterium]